MLIGPGEQNEAATLDFVVRHLHADILFWGKQLLDGFLSFSRD